MENEIMQKIKQLQKEVAKHDELYDKGQPIVTDTEYDVLYQELVDLENQYPELKKDSPTQKIDIELVDKLKKVKHLAPMLSLEKVNNENMLNKFTDKYPNEVYLLQDKMDGLTIVLTYQEGKLQTAISRGDGEVGEDLTHTVKTIKSLPKSINFLDKLVVRVEVYLSFEAFNKANTEGLYTSPRNLASGTLRQLDAAVANERELEYKVIEAVHIENTSFSLDIEQLTFIKSLGFTVVDTEVVTSSEIYTKIKEMEDNKRSNLPYMIDGMVIKLNNLNLRKELGYTSKYPKWAIAYKFKSLDAIGYLKDIVVQIGKTGQLTPVAIFDPVDIDGVTITRATLHNFANIKDKDVRIGDKILIARANDVIPQVVHVFKEQRENISTQVYEVKEECPICQKEAFYDGTHLFCVNEKCDAILKQKMIHFVSKAALNVTGFGDKAVELFFDEKFIKEPLDLYELEAHKEAILSLKGYSDKKYNKIVEGLETAKNVPFDRFIYSLSIPLIGKTASKEISKHFKDANSLLMTVKEGNLEKELEKLSDFGPKMKESFASYFNLETIPLWEKFITIGFTLKSDNYIDNQVESNTSLAKLKGLTFVITGALSRSRSEIQKELEMLGAKVTGSVTKNTNYLVMGSDAEGTSKHKKAITLNIRILTEEDLYELIQNI